MSEPTQTYRVHIYAVVRVPLTVDATSQAEAINKATEGFHLSNYLPSDHGGDDGRASDAEEITGYLVDEVGDTEYDKSRTYDAYGRLDEPRAHPSLSPPNGAPETAPNASGALKQTK